MKKLLCFLLCLTLIFSSVSLCFASATQWDTSDQANLRYIYQSVTSGGSLYNLVNNIYTRVNTISNTITDIKGYLYQGNHSIAYWVEAINSWMQPIYSKLSDILAQSLNIEAVAGLLGSTDVVDGTIVRTPYLFYQGKSVAQWVSEFQTYNEDLAEALTNFALTGASKNDALSRKNAHAGLFTNYSTGNYSLTQLNTQTGPVTTKNILWYSGSPIGNLAMIGKSINDNIAYAYRYNFLVNNQNYNNTQTAKNWLDLSNKTFTPSSSTNGLYNWLSNIQEPVARLSYVLASDERIAAQEAAAENEEAVVDNFIESSGSGAASASNIGSVASMSSGFSTNISTQQSASGIWDIFDSSHGTWFSQETANQLDTTSNNNRSLRSSGSFSTPLLDKRIEDIYNSLSGGDE